jgi:RHS repeat-associated protein
VVGSHDYDVFGYTRAQSGAGMPFEFTGQQQGGVGDLIYLRARYYEPGTGRFLSRDPFPGVATNPQTLNPYVYAQSNPTNLVDPDGQNPLLLALAIVGVGGTVLVAAALSAYLATPAGQQALLTFSNAIARECEGRDFSPPRGILTVPQIIALSVLLWSAHVRADLNDNWVMHHIASDKHTTKWTDLYKGVFAEAGTTLQDPFNLMPMPTSLHSGPHSEEYHLKVYRRISGAVDSVSTQEEKRLQLYVALLELRMEISLNPGVLYAK